MVLKPSDLGALPKEWKVVKFGEISKVRQGLQIAISERLTVPTPRSKEYITIQSINRQGQEREYVDLPSSRVVCGIDDVLMTRTGNTGIVVTGVEGVFHNNFFLIDFDRKKVDSIFLVNYLRSSKTQHVILTKAGSSTIPDLNHGDFYSIDFPLAPLSEQKKIAKIFSTWDKAINTTEQLLANSQQHKKTLMQLLLTGKKRLLDDNGVRFNGEWISRQLSHVTHVYNKKSTENNQFPIVTSSRRGLLLQEEYFKKQVASEDNIGYKIVPKGYVTFRSMSDDGIFVFNKQEILQNALISPAYGVFCFSGIDTDFGLYLVNSSVMTKEINKLSQGGTRIAFKTSVFSQIELKFPSNEEQQKIATALSTIDLEITTLQRKINILKQEKKALMQQLLTGNRRVVI